MPRPDMAHVHNRLLQVMPEESLARLALHLEHVPLARGQQIDRPDAVVRTLYFVDQGFVSMVKTMLDGRSVEVGGIGIEGVTDPHALLGMDAAVLDTVVQVPGGAYRIARDVVRAEMERTPGLRDLIEDYTGLLLGMLAQTAACNRLHSVHERAARWLLIAQDNSLSETFDLTHEFLATMLGVRRAGVSVALRDLRLKGVIRYGRGYLTILDRARLEQSACECYGSAQRDTNAFFAVRGQAGAGATSGRAWA